MAQVSYPQASNGFLAPDPTTVQNSTTYSAPTGTSMSPQPNSTAGSTPGPSGTSPVIFRAPAHKHAHHLHSIPPREKSTRTLIIDHMLWVHGRTRFAQARAELGMTDRTGGPSTPNYPHRQRPENFEEEEEVPSDGEDTISLIAREGGPGHPHNDDEDERISKQDLGLARNLRLRAEGLERVVTSMLDQPPPHHPILDDEFLDPPTSPKQQPRVVQGDPAHPHTLPNGVRLRLALATIVNDLFARQAPPPPYRYQQDASSNISGSATFSPVAPRALVPLATVSASPLQRNGSSATSNPQQPAGSNMSYVPPGYNMRSPATPTPSPRVRALYMAGADPTTANSPPAFRCPRHLHTGCEICVEAKAVGRLRSGSGNNTGDTPGKGSNSIGSSSNGAGKGVNANGLSGWRDGAGIGSGLARPGNDGCVLRRRSWSVVTHGNQGLGAGNTKLSELIPRFIRLSALVAMELGSEARDEEDSASAIEREKELEAANAFLGQEQRTDQPPQPSSPLVARATLGGATGQSQQNKMFAYALRPSHEWYMLLAGLLTRAVLEGYLTGGWSGLEPLECLLAVGMDIPEAAPAMNGRGRPVFSSDEDMSIGDEFDWLDPDGLPNLKEAARLLFPSLRAKTGGVRIEDSVEAEYVMEMAERLRRFYAIPESTPDVATHMEDLAWQYPAEPVERAAVRFCEAIAKWRGKPELETYKKKTPPQNKEIHATPGGSAMTIDSLLHSNPSSPSVPTINFDRPRRPPIEKFFMQPTPEWQNGWNGTKRRRSNTDDGWSGNKRVHG